MHVPSVDQNEDQNQADWPGEPLEQCRALSRPGRRRAVHIVHSMISRIQAALKLSKAHAVIAGTAPLAPRPRPGTGTGQRSSCSTDARGHGQYGKRPELVDPKVPAAVSRSRSRRLPAGGQNPWICAVTVPADIEPTAAHRRFPSPGVRGTSPAGPIWIFGNGNSVRRV